MSHPLISFIVPAYNVGQYLEACIQSIYSLLLHDNEIEVIVVNDGSTDHTPQLLEKISVQYPSLVVINQNNQGLSMARNNAIDKARGEYIAFVDADDELNVYCDTTNLTNILKEAKIDMIGVGVMEKKINSTPYPYYFHFHQYNQVYSPASDFMRNRNIFSGVWTTLYKRNFIEKHTLRFMPNIYHEDEEFQPRAFALASSFVALDITWYLRIVRPNSITTTRDSEKLQRRIRDILHVLACLDEFSRRDAATASCMKCKIDYLVVDILRNLFSQPHSHAFRSEIFTWLRAHNHFPLHGKWGYKYIIFRILSRLIAIFYRSL